MMGFPLLTGWYFWPMFFEWKNTDFPAQGTRDPSFSLNVSEWTILTKQFADWCKMKWFKDSLITGDCRMIMTVASKNLKLSPFVDLKWDVYSLNFMEHYGRWKMSGRLVCLWVKSNHNVETVLETENKRRETLQLLPWKLTCPLKINGWKMYSLLK